MKRSVFFSACAAVLFCAGCISYHYEGGSAGTETDPEELKVYTDAAKVPQKYEVLGTATASGDYQRISRERIIDRLKSEAGECGADAILLVEQQVLPAAATNLGKGAEQLDNDMGSSSWRNIHADVDNGYGQVFQQPDTTTLYRRMIRAEFIRYTDGR